LEHLVDGLSATVFRGKMHPVDLANRLVRQADLLVQEGPSGPVIPNDFTVAVNGRDLEPAIDEDRLAGELAFSLEQTATERGWRIGGPIRVRITTDASVGRGSIRCTAVAIPHDLPPWAQLVEHRGTRAFALGDNRILIGRTEEADVRLDQAEVSRRHAIIFRAGGRVWIIDTDSANGTSVNGISVGGDVVPIGLGDMLAFGPATFALRTV